MSNHRGPYRSYTDEQLRRAVASSTSLADILEKLTLFNAPSTRDRVRARITELGLPVDHFVKKTPAYKRTVPLADLLRITDKRPNANFKKRLIEAGLLDGSKCQLCDTTKWLGFTIALRLDHINGDARDNRLENLRLICGNCDALLPTFTGRNKARTSRTGPSEPQDYYGEEFQKKKADEDNARLRVKRKTAACVGCGAAIYAVSSRCYKCAGVVRRQRTKINWPPMEDLRQMVSEESAERVAKRLGVSGTTVRRRLR